VLYLKVSRDDGDGTEDKPVFVSADEELLKAVGTLIAARCGVEGLRELARRQPARAGPLKLDGPNGDGT